MKYEPLHHKYRPQTFAQLRGQEAIAQTLTNALRSGRIAPAYLFCGPRGTGKTSSARILAKSLNCVQSDKPTANPCGECEACRSISNGSALDFIEIDAATHTGVDNIRELIERAQYAPVKFRYKVYVIDECHMLSTAAFNALLKTLEEPPPNVVFILATTEPQRVLPTIVSRCQRFDFRRIPLEEMVKHLGEIASFEGIDITPEALSLVAQLSQGGMRDAQTLLAQLSLLSGKITPERVWDFVGAVTEQDLLDLLEAIASDEPSSVIRQCRRLLDRGKEPLTILHNLANFYVALLIAKTSPKDRYLVTVTEETWEKLVALAHQWELYTLFQGQKKLKDSEGLLRNTTQPRLWLEVTLLSLLPSANTPSVAPVITTPPSFPDASKTTSVDSSSPIPTVALSPTHLKKQLADIIDSRTTKTFFQQWCHITSIEGATVKIAVANDSLLGIARTQQKDIEKALCQLYQKPITVSFYVNPSLKNLRETPQDSPPQIPYPNSPIIDLGDCSTTANNPANKLEENQQQTTNTTYFPDKNSGIGLDEYPKEIPEKTVESILKIFKGEIIVRENRKSKKSIPAEKKVRIVNRPTLDGDEIPF
ncbi:MAG TPA: DNA polymerase III subunit gamma/tau [Geminocystis sp. M7585_C2015_104]|nr:DNA polymerase III subunit gamma/tau [Geminocystis sp. M7585_C2015_104]